LRRLICRLQYRCQTLRVQWYNPRGQTQ